MPAAIYDTAAPKRPVNVNINSDLVAKAKANGVNLSEALEARLVELVRRAEEQRWRQESAEPIRLYNERIENGEVLLSDLMWGHPDGAV